MELYGKRSTSGIVISSLQIKGGFIKIILLGARARVPNSIAELVRHFSYTRTVKAKTQFAAV